MAARTDHHGPLERLRRRLRVPVFTSVTVALGTGAHLVAGGGAPSAGQLGLITAVVAAICSAVAGRELRMPGLLGAVGLTEAGIHVALLGDHPGHAADRTGSAGMLLAHLAASVLLAWWLRRGEAALWRVVDRAVGRGALLLSVCSSSSHRLPRTARPAIGSRPRRLRRWHVGPVHPVRGPPRPA